MTRPRLILLSAAALLLAIPLALMMWPNRPLDLSKDEEPFRSMVLPPNSITAYTIMDGGSVRIKLIDRTGIHWELDFDIEEDRIFNSHPTAGYRTGGRPKTIPLKDPARAKLIAIRLIKSYAPQNNLGTTHALEGLADPAKDIAERFYRKFRSKLYETTGF